MSLIVRTLIGPGPDPMPGEVTVAVDVILNEFRTAGSVTADLSAASIMNEQSEG